MPRLKKRCPECDELLYEFYKQVLCLDCGRLEEPRRLTTIPTVEEDVAEALEILGTIHNHHIGIVNTSYRMIGEGPPGFARSPADKAKFHNRMVDRLDLHGDYVEMTNVIGSALESAFSSLSFHEKLAEKLQAQLEEKPTFLTLVRDEVTKRPWLRDPLLYVWKKATWGV